MIFNDISLNTFDNENISETWIDTYLNQLL